MNKIGDIRISRIAQSLLLIDLFKSKIIPVTAVGRNKTPEKIIIIKTN